MDQHTLVACARTLYASLPDAQFTESTFRELGRAAYAETPFERLSLPLRVTLLRLANAYHEKLGGLEVAAALDTTDEEAPIHPPTTDPGETPPASVPDDAPDEPARPTEPAPVTEPAAPETAPVEQSAPVVTVDEVTSPRRRRAG